jgi:hypothetical protein
MLANVLVLELFWSVDIQVAYYSEKTTQMTRRCTDNVTVTDYRFLFLTCWKRANALHGRNESSVLIV